MKVNSPSSPYAQVALRALSKIRGGALPPDAWADSAADQFPGRPASEKKNCPRSAFLGLIDEDLVTGVESGEYTKSRDNKRYAVDAVEWLKKEPSLARSPRDLWSKIQGGEKKSHNHQMHVVIALWENGDIKGAKEAVGRGNKPQAPSTNLEKIQWAMSELGPICDDCLSAKTMVTPRQTVNALCRRLEQQGLLARGRECCPQCGVTKIVNKQHGGSSPAKSLGTVIAAPRTVPVSPSSFQEGSFSSRVLVEAVKELVEKFAAGETEVYNEFSLQHELGILLRNRLPNRLVQFERNVAYFGLDKSNFVKREMDLVVFDGDRALLDAAVELKFPRNGQHPEQMFSFCKDVAFLEQLKAAGFNRAFFVVFVEDRLFYEGNKEGIYSYFRGEQELTGTITKPTGKRDSAVTIRGSYPIEWHQISGAARFAIIEVE